MTKRKTRIRPGRLKKDAKKIIRVWPVKEAKGKRRPIVIKERRLGKTYHLNIVSAAAYAPTLGALRKAFRGDFRGKEVLEYGPGVPVMLEVLERMGAKVTGIDDKPKELKKGARIKRGKIEEIEGLFPKKKFDAIIAKNLFEPTQLRIVKALLEQEWEKPTKISRVSSERERKIMERVPARLKDYAKYLLPRDPNRRNAALMLLSIFQETNRKLKNGGVFIIQTTGESWSGYYPFRNLLALAGFEVEVKRVIHVINPVTDLETELFIARKK